MQLDPVNINQIDPVNINQNFQNNLQQLPEGNTNRQAMCSSIGRSFYGFLTNNRVTTALSSGASALGGRVSALTARMPSLSGGVSVLTNNRVVTVLSNGASALGGRVSSLASGLSSLAMASNAEEQCLIQKVRLDHFSQEGYFSAACKTSTYFLKGWLEHHFVEQPLPRSQNNTHWTTQWLRQENGDLSTLGGLIQQGIRGKSEKIREMVEANVLLVGANIFDHFHTIMHDSNSPHYNSNFLLDVTLKVLDSANQHFKSLNHGYRKYSKEEDTSVLNAHLLDELDHDNILHSAISKDSSLNDVEKRKYALDNSLLRISKDLLKIISPEGGKGMIKPSWCNYVDRNDRIWKEVSEVIVPNIIYDKVIDFFNKPHLKRALLLKIIKKLKKTDIKIPENPAPLDRKQIRLIEICGNLSEQLIEFFLPELSSKIFMIPNIKKKIGEALGKIIRSSLKKLDIHKQLNQLVRDNLSILHSGKWEKKEGSWNFIPTDKDNKVLENFKFTFPQNLAEVQNIETKKEVKEQKLKQELIKEVNGFLDLKVKEALPDYIRGKLQKFQESVEVKIKRYFGENGAAISNRIILAIRILVDLVIAVLRLVTLPISLIFRTPLNNYLKKVSRRFVKKIDSSVHANVIAHSLEIFTKAIQIPGTA